MKINLESIEQASQPIELFYQGCKSEATKTHYRYVIHRVVTDYFEDVLASGGFEGKVNELVLKSKEDPAWAMKVMISLIKTLKEQTELPETSTDHIRPRTVNNYTNAMKKLFDMNEVPLVWRKLYSMLPEMNFDDGSRGYTRSEIQKMLRFADASDRVAVLITSSSGIRLGAFDFQWGDIKPVYLYDNKLLYEDEKITESVSKEGKIVCGMILIYKGSSSSQFAFITPETWEAVEDYRQYCIQEIRREPNDTDPFFKQAGQLLKGQPIKPLKEDGLASRIRRLVHKAGIRDAMTRGKKRYNIPLMNGFRRFFNKTNKESVSKDSMLGQLIKKEMMMGHSGLIQLDRNYFKIHVTELIEEYLNAVPNLTISDEIRKQTIIDKQQTTISKLKMKDAKIEDLEKQLEQVKFGLEAIKKSKKIVL